MTGESLSYIIHHLVVQPYFKETIGKYFNRKADRDNFTSHILCEMADIPLDKLQNAHYYGYLRWLFVRIVKNQVKSNNSSWHNLHRNRLTDDDPEDLQIAQEEDSFDEHMINKDRFKLIKPAINNILSKSYDKAKQKQIVVINMTCFNLYHFEHLTYKQISQKTNISEATVYRAVKNAEVLIRTEINKLIKKKK